MHKSQTFDVTGTVALFKILGGTEHTLSSGIETAPAPRHAGGLGLEIWEWGLGNCLTLMTHSLAWPDCQRQG